MGRERPTPPLAVAVLIVASVGLAVIAALWLSGSGDSAPAEYGAGEPPLPVSLPPSEDQLSPDAPAVPAEPAPEEPPPRLLWKIDTPARRDRFTGILPAGERVLAMRGGVLYALDADTGDELWRYPAHGVAAEWPPRAIARPPAFMIAVADDVVATRAPGELLRGIRRIQAVSLIDGAVANEYDLDLGGWAGPSRVIPAEGPVVAFYGTKQKDHGSEVVIFDVAEWREICRFGLPGKVVAARSLRVVGDRVGGIMRLPGEFISRAFVADFGQKEAWSVPVRLPSAAGGTFHRLLPDGRLLVLDGLLSPKCAYERPWPWPERTFVVADGVYVRDETGLCRVDPKNGRELWRFEIGYCGRNEFDYKITGTAEVVAWAEKGQLFLVDARTGRLRAFIAAADVFELAGASYYRDAHVACDGDRAYFATPKVLKAFSARPVDPDRPDPEDPSDPACAIARCRKALLEGDNKGALEAMRGIGHMVSSRPSAREEAAELLSQLSRCEARAARPDLWHALVYRDGWVAGEVFLDEYKRAAADNPGTLAMMIRIGTEESLRAVAEGLDAPHPDISLLAARAKWMLTGKQPTEELLATKSVAALLSRPMDDASFRRILPILVESDDGYHGRRVCIYPHQKLACNEGRARALKSTMGKRSLEILREQVESMKRGSGEKRDLQVTRPPEPVEPVEEEF